MIEGRGADRRSGAATLFVVLLIIYNANGREIGNIDSQPLKFAAREVAVNGTVILDRVVSERPGLAARPGFARDRTGHYRSAYPLTPALIAAVPAVVLHHTHLVHMDAPLASNLVAKLTASVLTAAAVALILAALRRIVPKVPAVFAAIAIGLGTNFWAMASQTLWRHETVAFGSALALWAWLREPAQIKTRHLILGGVGLALAVTSRPQVAVLVGMMLCWSWSLAGLRRALIPALITLAGVAAMVATNVIWFGDPLGALARLESVHPEIHGVAGPLSETPWIGAAGLLVSPSRGLLVFSPVLLIAVGAIGWPWRAARPLRVGWLSAGCALQFVAYALYAIWWGGHTYGPRYMVDVIAPLAPFVALGANRVLRSSLAGSATAALLLASILVAALGAFIYPNEGWNTNPAEVDRHHERLWETRDSQIERAIRGRPSPQNFNLFTWGAIRVID